LPYTLRKFDLSAMRDDRYNQIALSVRTRSCDDEGNAGLILFCFLEQTLRLGAWNLTAHVCHGGRNVVVRVNWLLNAIRDMISHTREASRAMRPKCSFRMAVCLRKALKLLKIEDIRYAHVPRAQGGGWEGRGGERDQY